MSTITVDATAVTIVPRCEQCAAPLSRRQGRACSLVCWRSLIRIPDARCPACRLPFRPRERGQKYCGRVCWLGAERPVELAVLACAQCGEGFTPWRQGSRFCSRRCVRQYKRGRHLVSPVLTALLTRLWRAGGQPVEIKALAHELYGCADFDELNAVRVHVWRLRRRLQHHRIETILRGRRMGAYRLVRLEATA